MSHRAETQHEVTAHRDDGLARGLFKPCAHLYVYRAAPPREPFFFIACREESFEAKDYWDVYSGVRAWNNPKCPDNCKHFKDRAAGEKEVRDSRRKKAIKSKVLAIPRALKGLAIWFDQRPWQVQLVIILSLLLLFAPRWAAPLIEIIKTIQGK